MNVLNMVLTFLLVTITWVFFRNHKAPVGRSFLILEKMAGFSFAEPLQTPLNAVEMWLCVFLIIFLLIKEHYYLKIPTRSTRLFFVLFPLILLANYFLGVVSENQFIYFQF